jgi:hypothetical protein
MGKLEDRIHRIHIQALRNMGPEARLEKAFELSDLVRRLFINGLKRRFPEISEEEFKRLVQDRLKKCHNRNY